MNLMTIIDIINDSKSTISDVANYGADEDVSKDLLEVSENLNDVLEALLDVVYDMADISGLPLKDYFWRGE